MSPTMLAEQRARFWHWLADRAFYRWIHTKDYAHLRLYFRRISRVHKLRGLDDA